MSGNVVPPASELGLQLSCVDDGWTMCLCKYAWMLAKMSMVNVLKSTGGKRMLQFRRKHDPVIFLLYAHRFARGFEQG
jgi:hypothetical protein